MTRKELECAYFELGKRYLKNKFGNHIGCFTFDVNDELKVFITTANDGNGKIFKFANPDFFEELEHTKG